MYLLLVLARQSHYKCLLFSQQYLEFTLFSIALPCLALVEIPDMVNRHKKLIINTVTAIASKAT